MSAKDAHLYSQPQPKKKSGKEISSSGSLAFTSQLSSLITSGKSQSDHSSTGRSHKKKEDIFTKHNRNAHKRAKKDSATDATSQIHKNSNAGEALDSDTWHRSKRKMEEKARLYAAMKRGDVDDEDGRHMVDFDRKWAEKEDKVDGHTWDNESSEESEAEPEEQIEWQDEFGRTRKGTKTEMLREQRRQQISDELETRARPAAPAKIIYGDGVQSDAFNPEVNIAERMAELAAKRDKSLTPPPETHFDSSREVRSKGVGFMQLSLDEEERKKQMENLQKDRAETERKRQEKGSMLEERRRKIEERRKRVQEMRGKRKADDFLDELGTEMMQKKDADAGEVARSQE